MNKKQVRTKVEATKVVTFQEANNAFSAYASADTEQDKINAELDEVINKLRDARATRLTELQGIKDAQFAVLKTFADGKPVEFGDKKSIDFPFGKIGFRTGTPALKTATGFTWAAVTNLLKKHAVLKTYLKEVVTLQKDKLLADRALPKFDKYFEKVGIEVLQTESFYVEPKKEEIKNAA